MHSTIENFTDISSPTTTTAPQAILPVSSSLKTGMLSGRRLNTAEREQIVNVTLASSMPNQIQPFAQALSSYSIKESRKAQVEVLELPYSGLDGASQNIISNLCKTFKNNESAKLVLLHSTSNRGWSITDDPGSSLYETFLSEAKKQLGKEQVAVVVHDFKTPTAKLQEIQLDSFRRRQPTTFECASFVTIIDNPESLLKDPYSNAFSEFLCTQPKTPPENPIKSQSPTAKSQSSESHLAKSVKSLRLTDKPRKSTQQPESKAHSQCQRKPIALKERDITEDKIEAKPKLVLAIPTRKELLANIQKQLREFTQCETELLELGFNVPSSKEAVMKVFDDFNVLCNNTANSKLFICHNIEDRRFAITDVLDALYNELLTEAHQELGPERVAVLAFGFQKESIEVRQIRMGSFRHQQPTTFKCAGFVDIVSNDMLDLSNEDFARRLSEFIFSPPKTPPLR